jgi:hypothetical protein
MEIQTKYQPGNTLWLISQRDGRLKEYEIYRIRIDYRLVEDASEEVWSAYVQYHGTDGSPDGTVIVKEEDEGRIWWKTRDEAVAYITGKLIPLGDRHSAVQKKIKEGLAPNCGLHSVKDLRSPFLRRFKPLPGILPKKSSLADEFERFFSNESPLDEDEERRIRAMARRSAQNLRRALQSEPHERTLSDEADDL